MRTLKVLASITLLLASVPGVQAGPQDWDPPIVPAPEPFSLSSRDAIHAVLLIRQVGLLQWWDGESRPVIVPVDEVYSVHVGFDPDAYEGHQNRYDLMLNGEPLDWDHLYIAYDEDVLNLRLLYTYRNQQPIPDVPYRL